MSNPQAILLLGPTGSGKTPLGEMLRARGLGNWRCEHFDFGESLRRIASGQLAVAEITDGDRAFIAQVLDHGALLENEHFQIAEKILRAFLAGPWRWHCGPQAAARERHEHSSPATIVLNGLPRHVGQADDVARIVPVRMVVELSCSARTVLQRLAGNAGGDRVGRIDDDPAGVQKRLELYTRRTEALVNHYRSLGADVITLTVRPTDTAEDAWRELTARWTGNVARQ